MTARTGMTDLITTLRGMAAAGTADYTVAGSAFWSDDQLQVVLDRHRAELNNSYCQAVPRVVSGGAISYLTYNVGYGNLEAGTAALAVENGAGSAYGTATYSVDCARGIISFTVDTLGLPVAVTGRSYDLNAAAADVWRQKAAAVAQAYDFKTDNHSMSRSQMMTMALQMAGMYEGMAAPGNWKIDRDDTAGLMGDSYDADEQ